MKGILDFSKYIGREVVYQSKYGGTTIGVVADIHIRFISVNITKQLSTEQPQITVRSTVGTIYNYNEIKFKI